MRAEMAAKISEQDAIAARQKAVWLKELRSSQKSAEESDRQRSQELFNVYQNDMESKYRSDIIGHRLDGIQIAKSALTTLPLEELTPLQRHETPQHNNCLPQSCGFNSGCKVSAQRSAWAY